MKWIILLAFMAFALLVGLAGAVFGVVASLLALAILIVGSVLVDFRIGVLGLLFFLPFSASPLLPQGQGLNVVNYLMLAAVLSLSVGTVFSQKRQFVWPPRQMWLLYLAPVAFGALLAFPHLGEAARNFAGTPNADVYTATEFAKGRVIKPLYLVVFAWLLANAVSRSRKPERFVLALTASAIVPALVVLAWVGVQGVSLAELQAQRSFMGPIGLHANEMAALLCFAIGPVLFGISGWQSWFARTLAVASLIALLVALTLTFSRGGYVAFAVIMVIYMVRQRHVLPVLALMTVLLIGVMFAPEAVKERLFTGVEQGAVSNTVGNLSDPLTAGRVAVWEKLLPEVARSPLWGRGLGSTAWSDLVRSGVYKAGHPHNMYLAMLMDVGVIGLAALLWWFVTLLKCYRQVARDPSQPPALRAFFEGTFASLVGVLVFSFTNGDYAPRPEHTYHWFAVGMAMAFWPLGAAAAGARGRSTWIMGHRIAAMPGHGQ